MPSTLSLAPRCHSSATSQAAAPLPEKQRLLTREDALAALAERRRGSSLLLSVVTARPSVTAGAAPAALLPRAACPSQDGRFLLPKGPPRSPPKASEGGPRSSP